MSHLLSVQQLVLGFQGRNLPKNWRCIKICCEANMPIFLSSLSVKKNWSSRSCKPLHQDLLSHLGLVLWECQNDGNSAKVPIHVMLFPGWLQGFGRMLAPPLKGEDSFHDSQQVLYSTQKCSWSGIRGRDTYHFESHKNVWQFFTEQKGENSDKQNHIKSRSGLPIPALVAPGNVILGGPDWDHLHFA